MFYKVFRKFMKRFTHCRFIFFFYNRQITEIVLFCLFKNQFRIQNNMIIIQKKYFYLFCYNRKLFHKIFNFFSAYFCFFINFIHTPSIFQTKCISALPVASDTLYRQHSLYFIIMYHLNLIIFLIRNRKIYMYIGIFPFILICNLHFLFHSAFSSQLKQLRFLLSYFSNLIFFSGFTISAVRFTFVFINDLFASANT